MTFVWVVVLTAVVTYGAYLCVRDPVARAAAHETLRKRPLQWTFVTLWVGFLIMLVSISVVTLDEYLAYH